MDAAGRAGFQKITDGTNTMPTLDAVGRRGYIQLTDGTTAVGMDTSTTSINVNIAKDSTAAPTTPLQVSSWDQSLTNQQTVLGASTAAAATDKPAVVALHPSSPAKIFDGTNTATVKAASTAAVARDTSLVVAVSPNTPAKMRDGTNTATVTAASTSCSRGGR